MLDSVTIVAQAESLLCFRNVFFLINLFPLHDLQTSLTSIRRAELLFRLLIALLRIRYVCKSFIQEFEDKSISIPLIWLH